MIVPSFFLRILFPFSLLVHPTRPGNFLPQNHVLSGTSELLFLVEERKPAGLGFGTGLAQEKKEFPLKMEHKKR